MWLRDIAGGNYKVLNNGSLTDYVITFLESNNHSTLTSINMCPPPNGGKTFLFLPLNTLAAILKFSRHSEGAHIYGDECTIKDCLVCGKNEKHCCSEFLDEYKDFLGKQMPNKTIANAYTRTTNSVRQQESYSLYFLRRFCRSCAV